MRINPSIANQMYLNSNDDDTSCLPTGTYSGLAAAKYVKDNDKDNNGVLSSDEVTLSAEAYAKLDADSDGKVTKDEMKTALAGKDDAIFQYYKNGGADSTTADLTSTLLSASNSSSTSTSTNTYSNMAAKKYLQDMDTNGDGALSADEVSLSTSIFSELDQDSSGEVSSSELKTSLSSQNSAILKYYQNGGTSTLTDLTSRLLKTI